MKKLLLLIGCFISINTWAVDCKHPQGSYEIQSCLNQELVQAKKELNQVYQHIYTKTAAQAELEAAQKAWLKYRELQCGEFTAKDSDYSPGSVSYDLSCQTDLTIQRIDFLKSLDF